MTDENLKTICFDYSHNNTLTIESPSYADFTHFLFSSSFRLGKIQAGFNTIDKLKKYRLLIIGGPINSEYTKEEIEVISEFVKEGGSLFVINGEGGDYKAGTNLSELTQNFGFVFNDDIIYDSLNFVNEQSRIRIDKFEPHIITRDIKTVVLSKPCSISTNDLIEAEGDVALIPLIKTGFNSYREYFDGEKWVENADAPKSILALYVKFYKGKVIALTSLSLFSSLSSLYGYHAFDNARFISNIFEFLLSTISDKLDVKLITINLNYNLLTWAENLVQEGKWNNVDDIINFAVKYLKDNYNQIFKTLKQRREKLLQLKAARLAKIKDKEARKAEEERLKSEESIYDLVDRSKESVKDLEKIMESLRNITGGEVGADFSIDEFEIDEEFEEETIEEGATETPSEPSKSEKAEIPGAEEANDLMEEVIENSISEDEEALIDEEMSGEIGEKIERAEQEIDEEGAALTEQLNGVSDEIEEWAEEPNESIESERVINKDDVEVGDEKMIGSDVLDMGSTAGARSSAQVEFGKIFGDNGETHDHIDENELAERMKNEFEQKLKEKLSTITPKKGDEEEELNLSESDLEIEEALSKLGSFEEFSKKLKEFQELDDEDEPISLFDDDKKKKKNVITDDDIFD